MKALRRSLIPLAAILLAACADEGGEPAGAAPSEAAVDRDTWWNGATRTASGAERVLAPRELRALLDEGRRLGHDTDPDWWARRTGWAGERILELDPDDVDANRLAGRRTLQGIEGFADLWPRLVDSRAPTDGMAELLDTYGPWVEEGRPIFLTAEEHALATARLAEAREHLAKLEGDPAFAGEQRLLQQVRTSVHADFPFVHVRSGPFLVFYAARDLQRDPEGEASEEETRISARRDFYLRRLAEWTGLYGDLVADLRGLYPEAWAAHAASPDVLFPQWIFADPEWYESFTRRVRRDEEEAPYRTGFLHPATGWAYLLERQEAGAETAFRETAAYLAALQVLRHWARDPLDPTANRWDRSEAFWFKEGLPAYLASRRVANPVEGAALRGAWQKPPLLSVIERRSRLDRQAYLMPHEEADPAAPLPPDGGYTDLAWLAVRALNSEGRRPAFERYLRSQLEGTEKGIRWFEECFGVDAASGWRDLEREIYSAIE